MALPNAQPLEKGFRVFDFSVIVGALNRFFSTQLTAEDVVSKMQAQGEEMQSIRLAFVRDEETAVSAFLVYAPALRHGEVSRWIFAGPRITSGLVSSRWSGYYQPAKLLQT